MGQLLKPSNESFPLFYSVIRPTPPQNCRLTIVLSWRWIFYLNIPICGIALVAIALFMRMKSGAQHQLDGLSKLRRLDWLGSLVFIPSMVSILLGLIMGGVAYPWSSWRIILPIVLGAVGWAAFHVQQSLARFPSVPNRLFRNRTSAVSYALTFASSLLIQATAYFLPVYFQGVKGTTILDSGTFFLPYAIGSLVFAVIGGVLLSKTGVYRPFHAASFALSAVGFGLFTLLDNQTPSVAWVFFQLIISVGHGFTLSTLLPAILVGLPESFVASGTAAYAFVKTFGYIWGVTIASIIFNSAFNSNLYIITDPALQVQLKNGAGYAFASQIHLLGSQLSSASLNELTEVYTRSLRIIWWVGLGISLVCLLAVVGEDSLDLRTQLETEYGLEEKQKTSESPATEETGRS